MKLTDKTYFAEYHQRLGRQIEAWFKAFDFSEAAGNLGYKTAASDELDYDCCLPFLEMLPQCLKM